MKSSSHTATNDSAHKRRDLLRLVFETDFLTDAMAAATAEAAYRVQLGGYAKSSLGFSKSKGSIKMAELEVRAKQPKGSRAGSWPIPAAVGAAFGRAQARSRGQMRASAAAYA